MRLPLTAAAAFSALLTIGIAPRAMSQETERFRLERTDDGYVRMDTRTGDMTICRERSGELVCRAATEAEEGGTSDIESLRDRLADLEARVKALEQEGSDVPTENEFEQTMDLMERFFQRFADVVRGLEDDMQDTTPEESVPPGDASPSGNDSSAPERT